MASVITSNDGALVLNGGSSSVPKGGYVVSTDSVYVYVKANCSRTVWKLDYRVTTLDGVSYSTPQELVEALSVFSGGGTGPGSGVQSIVAGPGISVDDSDPANPIVSSDATAPKWDDIQDKPTVIASGDTQADARSALGLGSAATQDSSDFATAAQGELAATAVQPSGLPTWTTISGKPDFVAEGANAAAARTALGLGTAATQDSGSFATSAQGALADTAVQPSDTSDVADAGKVVKYSNIGAVNTAEPQFPENAVPLWFFNAVLSSKQDALSTPSQAEAEGGSAPTPRSWSAQRDRQAIVAASRQTVPVSANKTLDLADEYTYQRVTAAATITIPTNASVELPVGAVIDFFQAGSGAITFSPESGVTVNSYEDTLVTDGKGSAATLKKVGTNEWDLII